MRRIILPALLLFLCVLPSNAQYGRYGNSGAREAQRTVARWYERYLGREPDPYSAIWVQSLQKGQDPERVLAGILGSDEYYQRGGGTPRGFVQQIYNDVSGRRPTPRELEHWAHEIHHRPLVDVAYAILTRNAQNHDDDRDHSDRYDYRRPASRYR